MLSIEQTRKILGKNAEGLTDEQLTEIRDGYRDLVDIIFEKWLEDKKAGRLNAKGQIVPSPQFEHCSKFGAKKDCQLVEELD